MASGCHPEDRTERRHFLGPVRGGIYNYYGTLTLGTASSPGYYTRDYSPTPTTTDHKCASASISSGVITYGTHAVCLDRGVRSSSDNFAGHTHVTTESANSYIQFAGAFISDYTGVAVDRTGSAHAVWTDFRGHPAGMPAASDVTAPNQDTVVENNL